MEYSNRNKAEDMDEIDAENKNLKGLFKKWKGAVSFGDSFVEDGALPGYSRQKLKKILFIGREVHSGCTSIVKHIRRILNGEIGADDCWALTIKVAYGLPRDRDWEAIPPLEELQTEFKEGKFSFAVMEASKYSNDGETTDLSSGFEEYAYESMGVGENASSRNFTREEIEILKPDLIISWNFMDALGPCFLQTLTKIKASSYIPFPPDIAAWAYKFSSGRKIPLLDTWHFSAVSRNVKDAKTEIYEPLRKALKTDVLKELIEKRKSRGPTEPFLSA